MPPTCSSPRSPAASCPAGFIGVDVFFVLSGFLITCLLLEEWDRSGRIDMRQFFLRRTLRLVPALWVVMVVQLLYTLVLRDPLKLELKGLAAVALYVGNWSWKFGAVIPATFGQTWSLAAEAQFYLVWPFLLVLLLRKRGRRLIAAAMIGLVAVAFSSRLLLWHTGHPWNEISVQTHVRLDALMIGALLAYGLRRGWRPPRRIGAWGLAGGAFLVLVALFSHREDGWLFNGGYTLVALAAALVICAALDQGTALARILMTGPVRLLGRLSYSIYLWHMLIFIAVQRAWPTSPGLVRLAVGFGLTAVASVTSYQFVEKPFLRLKRASSLLAPSGPPAVSVREGARPPAAS